MSGPAPFHLTSLSLFSAIPPRPVQPPPPAGQGRQERALDSAGAGQPQAASPFPELAICSRPPAPCLAAMGRSLLSPGVTPSSLDSSDRYPGTCSGSFMPQPESQSHLPEVLKKLLHLRTTVEAVVAFHSFISRSFVTCVVGAMLSMRMQRPMPGPSQGHGAPSAIVIRATEGSFLAEEE